MLGLGVTPLSIPMMGQTLIQRAIAIFRRFGQDAHIYLPGVGMLNGLQAGNYLDSALTTPAAIDNPVGGVVDAVGGINATQPTTASKPILRRGAVNLLTYSGDFSNAAWAKIGATVSGGKLLEDAANSGHSIAQAFTPTAGTTYTAVVSIKASERSFAFFGLNGGGVGATFASIDLSTGALSASTGSPLNLTSTLKADGYWLVTLSMAAISTASMPLDVRVSADGVWANRVYQGVSGSGIFVQATALFQGTYTAAQIQALGGIPVTTTAPASTALGPMYWQFDGSNDSLSLGGPLFQASDDHYAGVAVAQEAGTGTVAALSVANPTTAAMALMLGFTGSPSVPSVYYYDDASQLAIITGINAPYGTRRVLSSRKSGVAKSLFIDGVFVGVNNTALGATLANNSNIGATSTGSLLNGSLAASIAIKGSVSAADALLLDKLLANFQGRTL